jgi:hypothetical protein
MLPIPALGEEVNFTGSWSIDIRSKLEKKRDVECGEATFVLVQKGDKICGDHLFLVPGCGRMNEGNPGSVRGTVMGNQASLEVTSGRNGAVVTGTATRKGNELHWVTHKEIKPGDPPGDSPLILDKGIFKFKKSDPIPRELLDLCKGG